MNQPCRFLAAWMLVAFPLCANADIIRNLTYDLNDIQITVDQQGVIDRWEFAPVAIQPLTLPASASTTVAEPVIFNITFINGSLSVNDPDDGFSTTGFQGSLFTQDSGTVLSGNSVRTVRFPGLMGLDKSGGGQESSNFLRFGLGGSVIWQNQTITVTALQYENRSALAQDTVFDSFQLFGQGDIVEVTATPLLGGAAYVTNASSDDVSVIDIATNTVEATIAVGSEPLGVAITPDGAFAYVANISSSNVSVINTATNVVDTTVPVDNGPFGVAITPDGAFAYVAGPGGVSVINTATNVVDATVAVSGAGIAITPDGSFAYVAGAGVSVIDTATNVVVATVPVGAGPLEVAITPDGAWAYVTNNASNDVSVINTTTNMVVATVAVGGDATDIAITPDGAFAYVTLPFSDEIAVIDTGTNVVDATFAVAGQPRSVAFTPDGSFAYVTNALSGEVSVLNTATNAVVATIAAGDIPFDIAIMPEVPSPVVEVVDQVNEPLPVNCSTTLGSSGGNPAFAQTVTAGVSGTLDAIDFSIQRPSQYLTGDPELQIRNVSSGNPGSVILGSKTIPVADLLPFPSDPSGFARFDVSDLGITVTQGEQIAIVWQRPTVFTGDGRLIFYCSGGTAGDPDGFYAGGGGRCFRWIRAPPGVRSILGSIFVSGLWWRPLTRTRTECPMP